ncbi:hypothetical protein GOBAR_DD22792 [Gossypium barbadense]|nr:hypothetical protein GOBAR_DD22792 [Gossypium barbadense]
MMKTLNSSSVGNQIRRIVIHNNLRAHMSPIDPDAVDASEFLEYLKILPAHQLAVDSDLEELFVGQRFENTILVFSIIPEGMDSKTDGNGAIILILAIAQDKNKNVFPIVFAIVDKVGYLDAKNGAVLSQPDGGGTRKYIHDVMKRFELQRPSIIDPVYHLGPTELISETDDVITGGSKHLFIPSTCLDSLC